MRYLKDGVNTGACWVFLLVTSGANMRVAVLCQDAMLRDGLLSVVGSIPQVEIVAADGRMRSIAALAGIGQVDVVVVPSDALASTDVSALQTLRVPKGPRMVAITAQGSLPLNGQRLFDAFVPRSAGAHGLRSTLGNLRLAPRRADFGTAERAHSNGSTRLTKREHQVAQLIGKGMPNRKIAEVLGIREQSVKNLVSVLLKKLECENRVQVALQLTRL